MVPAPNFCIAYVVVDVLCAILTVIVSSNVSRDSGSESQVRCFFLLLTAYLVFVVFDAVWAILVFSQVFSPSMLLLGIVNGINLTAVAFTAYFWLSFTALYLQSPMVDSMSKRIVIAIPALLVVVFHAIGHALGQNVIFLGNGHVAYGYMHSVNTVIPLLYLLVATKVALERRRVAIDRATRRLCLVFIMFMIAPAAAGVFDIFVPDMPVAAAGIMVSIIFVIMAMQESRISNDALTGLNNRRRANAFLERCITHSSTAHPLFLFIVDLDHFKAINDTYGHLEGDRALQLTAQALRMVCAKVNAFAARWGGDEFVLISTRPVEGGPDHVSKLIQGALLSMSKEAHTGYELACSVGYAKCESSDEACDQLVLVADRMLYANKQAAHARR